MLDFLVENESGKNEETILEKLSQLQNCKKSKASDIKDDILEFSEEKLNDAWRRLREIYASTLENCCQTKENEEITEESSQKFDAGCSILSGVTTLAVLTVEAVETIPNELKLAVSVLNGILNTLPLNQFKLKNKIANLCETIWLKDAEAGEKLLPNLFIYLFQKTTTEKAMKVDLKRLWNLRYAFKLVVTNNEEDLNIRRLMETAMKSENFVDVVEGRKILSLILCLNEELMMDLHACVKERIGNCTKKQARGYGEVYYKSWCCITGPLKENLETNCIQDLMFHAIHAKNIKSNSIFLLLQAFLSNFHAVRQRDVTEMLFKLYEPILWRSFKVPNANVRGNAAAILFDAFPLENRELSMEENDAWFQKQLSIMKDLLMDSSPKIRMTATFGVCVICNRFWEIIPRETIHSFLTTLVDDLRVDVSSSSVRASVFKGLIEVLNNPCSHVYLKTLLSKIRDSFHDSCDAVRVTVADLLLKVKMLKTIEYWSIIPAEHLFARLEIETPPVARRIVKLLFNSFFPKGESKTLALDRAVFFIKTHRPASRKFYRYAHELMNIKDVVIFLLKISPCLNDFVTRKFATKVRNKNVSVEDIENIDISNKKNKDKDNDDENDSESSCLADSEVLTGLIDIVAITWAGILTKLRKPENKKLEEKLHNAYQETAELFCHYCKDNECWDSLLFISSFIPPSRVGLVRKHCLSKVRSFTATATSDSFGTYVIGLCRWGYVEELVEILTSWLSEALKLEQTPHSTRKKRKVKSVRFVEPFEVQPVLACNILCWIFEQPLCYEILLNNRPVILACWQLLKSSLDLIEKRLNNQISNEFTTDEFLQKAFLSYCRITVILHGQSRVDSCRIIGEILEWINNNLLAQLTEQIDDDKIHFCVNLLQPFLLLLSDMALVGLVTRTFLQQCFIFSKTLLKSEIGLFLLENISRLAYQIVKFGLSRKNKNEIIGCLQFIPKFFDCIIQIFAQKSKENKNFPIPEQLQPIFSELILAFVMCKSSTSTFKEILSTFIVAVLTSLAADIIKSPEFPVFDTWTELSPLVQFFITLFASKVTLARLFLSGICENIRSNKLTKHPGPLAIVSLVHMISMDKKFSKLPGMITVTECAEQLLKDSESNEVNVTVEGDEQNSLESRHLKSASILLTEVKNALNSTPNQD